MAPLGARDYLVRRVKLMLFRRSLHHVDIMVAQSATMRERLAQLYRIPDIEVVENAVSLDNLAQGESHDFALGDGFKFLCLSVYYTHKNIEIFLPVARAIKARGLGFKIVTTIAPEQHAGAAAFLANVAAEELDDVIVNVGPVSMELVPALFRQCNALLLPTLLESFSGTYVEAMFHGLPIVTSDLDFATGVCHDAAWYFDPCDAASVLAQMVDVSTDPKRRAARVTRGRTILAGLPNWHEAARRLEAMFDRVAAAAARAGHDRETQ